MHLSHRLSSLPVFKHVPKIASEINLLVLVGFFYGFVINKRAKYAQVQQISKNYCQMFNRQTCLQHFASIYLFILKIRSVLIHHRRRIFVPACVSGDFFFFGIAKTKNQSGVQAEWTIQIHVYASFKWIPMLISILIRSLCFILFSITWVRFSRAFNNLITDISFMYTSRVFLLLFLLLLMNNFLSKSSSKSARTMLLLPMR